jgi:hypothetical protein
MKVSNIESDKYLGEITIDGCTFAISKIKLQD